MSKKMLNQAASLKTYQQVAEKLVDELSGELATNRLVLTIFKEDDGRWSGYVEMKEFDLKEGDILLTKDNLPRIVTRDDGRLWIVDLRGIVTLRGESLVRKWIHQGNYRQTGETVCNLVELWMAEVENE